MPDVGLTPVSRRRGALAGISPLAVAFVAGFFAIHNSMLALVSLALIKNSPAFEQQLHAATVWEPYSKSAWTCVLDHTTAVAAVRLLLPLTAYRSGGAETLIGRQTPASHL